MLRKRKKQLILVDKYNIFFKRMCEYIHEAYFQIEKINPPCQGSFLFYASLKPKHLR